MLPRAVPNGQPAPQIRDSSSVFLAANSSSVSAPRSRSFASRSMVARISASPPSVSAVGRGGRGCSVPPQS